MRLQLGLLRIFEEVHCKLLEMEQIGKLNTMPANMLTTAQIITTLGPKVCKSYLPWAIWIPRVGL